MVLALLVLEDDSPAESLERATQEKSGKISTLNEIFQLFSNLLER